MLTRCIIDCNIQQQPATTIKWTECLHVSRQQMRQETEVYTRTYRTGSEWEESPSETHTHGAEKKARMIKKLLRASDIDGTEVGCICGWPD